MKVILSHPTGNANVRALAEALAANGMLDLFYTSVATFPNSLLDHFGKFPPLVELHRRRFDATLESHTRQWPWRELGRQAAVRSGLRKLVKHETGAFSVDSIYQSLDRRVASTLRQVSKTEARSVYAYEDGALSSFHEAQRLSIKRFYDLPIGYWRSAQTLLSVEQEQWPDWASTLTGFMDSPEKLARKDEEILLANQIFVASSFTARTLLDFPGSLPAIQVIPYGFPTVANARVYNSLDGHCPLRLLFVGGLSQRKGIANLFAAVETFGKHIQLTVVGRKTQAHCPSLDIALAKHRWIPSMPHTEVLQLMQQHDALIFPSLFEGFGLVITEAMSQGTPVITTERTAGPDLIKHNENGWITKAGDVDSLRAAIEALLHQPKQLKSVGEAALATAQQRPWSVYGNEMAAAINKSTTVHQAV